MSNDGTSFFLSFLTPLEDMIHSTDYVFVFGRKNVNIIGTNAHTQRNIMIMIEREAKREIQNPLSQFFLVSFT
jgi:hypothetical protein